MSKTNRGKLARIISGNAFLKGKLLAFALGHLKDNKPDFEYFVEQFLQEFPDETEKFPSVFNRGLKHIEKVIALARKTTLPSDHVIVDVGGAAGEVALIFAGSFPAARVYSFEPVSGTYKKLVAAVRGHKNITPVNKGLGSTPSTAEIHVAQRVTSSSLLPPKEKIDDPFLAASLKQTAMERITISTLDRELPNEVPVSILKMDVQGYELEVLKGAVQTLKRTSLVVLELMNHDFYTSAPRYYQVDEFLRQQGFSLFDMVPSIRNESRLYEWDAIYLNDRIG